MLSESALYPAAPVIAQPGSTLSPAPGSVPENGVSVRLLQDTPADAEFAGRLTVEGFRGKFAHNITERKYVYFLMFIFYLRFSDMKILY
jgi:hypothetical protein